MKYRFEGKIVVEAGSAEDALRQVAQNVSTAARHVGDGHDLGKTGAFFTLTEDARGEPVDLRVDPLAAQPDAPAESSTDVTRADKTEGDE